MTKACNGWVRTGRRSPAWAAIVDTSPPTALITTPAEMSPLAVRTHPLQAFVTNGYAQGLGPIVSSTDLLCYVSQTARGQMLIGHEFERESSYSRQSSFQFLQSCSLKMALLLPFVRNLKILRQWTGRCDISADFSPIMGFTGVEGLVITTGWGTWGFKGIPAGGEQMAELIATNRTPDLIAPFALSRFAADHAMADQGSTGTRSMLTITCPNCGPRPVEEFRFGGELPQPPANLTGEFERDLDRVWMFTNVDGVEVERWFHEAGCHRWHTARRDTTLDRFVE